MVDTPTVQEILEVLAGELRATVSPEAEGNSNFPEVSAEDPYDVGGSSITITRNNDRPSGELVSNDEEGLPRDAKKVS